ncbi:hypothetical protein GCM10007301_09050 [Azorhizobium oxalatiphilum]|uniref:Uncharacterized protein n=1 Tax=Azorhizobium oxalatiphilum TaxID=980631 RepID=A0A917F660_9HYPH|nr:hypothetical protein [Azorhizobium oxalatiphilum]GGF51803.1 hypothetical protein GCM10007301_09050 [Azorhizobium oxalatiphilum]
MRLSGLPLAAFSAIALASLAAPAQAEGFTTRDLTSVSSGLTSALGSGFIARSEAKRVTLMCQDCKGNPMIDVLIGRQSDGTEQRIRSGQTSIAHMEKLCQDKSPTCKLTKLEVAPAVGWISAWPMGDMSASTAIILRDGDMLTVRSLAADPATARSNAQKVVTALGPLIGK